MGLFDKIKDFIESDTVKDITKAVGSTVNSYISEQTKAQHSRESVSHHADSAKSPIIEKILASGNIPLKPCFKIEDEYGDRKYSFELSGDFIEFNSHSEFDPSYQYEPFSEDEFTDYNDNLPVIAIGPSNTIYNAAKSYESGGTVSNIETAACGSPYFLFSTKFKEYGKIYYAYAFAGKTAREYEMLCVQYDPEIRGTSLERKLISALDSAAASYTEENNDS